MISVQIAIENVKLCFIIITLNVPVKFYLYLCMLLESKHICMKRKCMFCAQNQRNDSRN